MMIFTNSRAPFDLTPEQFNAIIQEKEKELAFLKEKELATLAGYDLTPEQVNAVLQEKNKPMEFTTLVDIAAIISGLVASGGIAIDTADYLMGRSPLSINNFAVSLLVTSALSTALSIALKYDQESSEKKYEKSYLVGRVSDAVHGAGATLMAGGMLLTTFSAFDMVVASVRPLLGRCLETRQIPFKNDNQPYDVDVCKLAFDRATSAALGAVLLCATAFAVSCATSIVNRVRKVDNVPAAPAA
jgi:hypothetical protein